MVLVKGGLVGRGAPFSVVNRKDEWPPQWEMAFTQSNNAVVGWGGGATRLVEDINVNTVSINCQEISSEMFPESFYLDSFSCDYTRVTAALDCTCH